MLFIITAITKSQYPPCSPTYPGLSFQANHLTAFPPYSLSMPYDVLLAYVALDSFCRHAYLDDIQKMLLRQTYNDTMQYIYKYFYEAVDYDPIRFFLTLKYNNINVIVTTPQELIHQAFVQQQLKVSPNKSLDYALLQSSFIARVNITDTIGIVDANAKNLARNVYIVTSQILDTIKGKVIPTCNNYYPGSGIKKDNNKSNLLTLTLPGACLQFNYCLDWRRGGNYGPTLRDDNGEPWIKKDHEYIVFLNTVLECEDSSGVYYCIRPAWPESYTFRMYPINNGIVYDPNNEFGFGPNQTAADFINNLRSRINQIKNFGQ